MEVDHAATTDVASGNGSILKKGIVGVLARISKSRKTTRSVVALLSSSITSSVLGALGGLLVARFLGPRKLDHSVPLQSL